MRYTVPDTLLHALEAGLLEPGDALAVRRALAGQDRAARPLDPWQVVDLGRGGRLAASSPALLDRHAAPPLLTLDLQVERLDWCPVLLADGAPLHPADAQDVTALLPLHAFPVHGTARRLQVGWPDGVRAITVLLVLPGTVAGDPAWSASLAEAVAGRAPAWTVSRSAA